MEKRLSVIIPSYNEEANIDRTASTVLHVLDEAAIPCELIFVSDGSKDGTYTKIAALARADARVHGIEFSRNFGKEAAISAGLAKGGGDCFVIMDCDLQHPPQYIVQMYRLWEQGYEIVEGIKITRGKESKWHQKCSAVFYRLLSRLTGFDMHNTSDFKLLDKKVADVLLSMPERKMFFRALTFWTGFRSTQVRYDVAERQSGTSKWSTAALVRYAVSNIISFSSAPLHIVTYFGVLSVIFGLIVGIQTFVRWLCHNAVEGFTTVILLLLLIGGCILIGLGLIGSYIAAIYEEIKQRPRYIVRLDTDVAVTGETDEP